MLSMTRETSAEYMLEKKDGDLLAIVSAGRNRLQYLRGERDGIQREIDRLERMQYAAIDEIVRRTQEGAAERGV